MAFTTLPAAGAKLRASVLSALITEIRPLLAWSTWTPTLSNLTQGNGTVVAKYTRLGNTVDYRFKITLGSTSVVGTSPRFTLPVVAHSEYADFADRMGDAALADAGTNDYDASVRLVVDSQTAEWRLIGTNGLHGAVTATSPFTFGVGDSLSAYGRYETA